jgi:hypothetical protein
MTELEGINEGAQPADKPIYFDDPAIQTLYQMVLVLGEELAATREQLHALIALSEKGVVPTAEAIESFLPDDQFDAERADWVARLLEPLEKIAGSDRSP